ncbi:hypothetical protein C6A37_00150 [Desulfobacteraceae bacterium SEEP-SAG9]|nr:hypothetical protein C6A37_00150 [Desulfobacteraceae bacterium SEEP-SAG9]
MNVLVLFTNIFLVEAFYRILTPAAERLRKLDIFCEKTNMAAFDAVMDAALQCVACHKAAFLPLMFKPVS